MRYARGAGLGIVALTGAWLGCNAILGNEPGVLRDDVGVGGGAGAGATSSSSSSAVSSAISSGTGGAGGASVGAGGAGQGGAGVGGAGGALGTYEWILGSPSIAQGCVKGYSYTIPKWLQFSSPTVEERTSQIGVDKLCRGYPQDFPRARNVGSGWGLNIESQRKNLVLNSDSWNTVGTGWGQGNMVVTPTQADPAGGTGATLFTSPAGNIYPNYSAPPTNSQVGSTWARGSVGGAPFAHFHHYTDGMSNGLWVDVDTIGWKRYSIAQTATQKAEVVLDTRDIPVGAGVIPGQKAFVAFGAQMEDGALYPSSYIPTLGSAVTRLAETLSSVPGKLKDLAPGGYFNITLKLAPNFAMTSAVNEMTADEYSVIYFDNQNCLFIRKSDRRIVLRVNGVQTAVGPIEFFREQELTITATNRVGDGFRVAVAGATVGDGQANKAPESPVSIGPMDVVSILSTNSGAQECSDLRSIQFALP